MFKENSPLYSSDIVRESGENVMYINYLGANYVPDLANYFDVMARTIDLLMEDSNISRIVYVQQRNYSHNFEQVNMLIEVAQLYDFFTKQEKIISVEVLEKLGYFYEEAYSFLNYIINEVLKGDPIRAYRELKGALFEQRALSEKGYDNLNYLRLLEKIISSFERLILIQKAKELFNNFKTGDREIYSEFFRPDIMPNFTFTRMIASLPKDAEIIKEYEIAKGYDKSVVTIFKEPNKTKLYYHLIPPEYNLSEDFHMLLNLARNVLIEHKPTQEEFNDSERTRGVFLNVSKDLLRDLANNKGINLSYDDLNLLSNILVRHTIGFGVLEVLLEDESLQDLMINAPVSLTPVFVRHNDYGECVTNLIPSKEDADSWATKFRMSSGRALDEANPILDTNLELPNSSSRVAIIQQPLSNGGLAYTLRRHRNKPWTLPLFMKTNMINGLGAGLLSFIIDGARTLLVAGTRSSGKTSLLGSLLLEIMPNLRIITIEDTLELPVGEMRKLDYDILSMKVRSSLGGESNEVDASEGIRASLRLGDSSLIVGEIRSEEAKSLYEAMRVGALANVVAGTIHGGSPYSVFDRVVNDLQVPITSFKATDLIIVCNPVKSVDGLSSYRRVLSISEVRKHWEKDPLSEGGFVDLMKYDVYEDKLKPTDDLINGDSEILKEIAANVKGWAGNWDAVWDNIILRQKIKEELVNVATKLNNFDLLEAEFVVKSNNAFHQISNQISSEFGLPKSEEVFSKWKKWLEKEIKIYL
ncbi:MAG: type II/IV secretion system ATPase subunit [Candidatus Nanoarchaeia archaeon]|nr:type II/IV secretion system ATPase subunit [Candidatus Nanoarchaeia archaeon]MDD4563592.1 type II/IV secretion system ATPase subunit [Candidatus Nanoarchaeia archaeon]